MTIDWRQIQTVFLDMDGTLLDLHFDNYFWLEHVPRRYAEKNRIEFDRARQELIDRYRQVEGTMEWYCLDFWTRELGLDIPVLKEEVDHLIAVHPHVPEFLDWLRSTDKRVVLVTNAHGMSLDLKMRKTGIGARFDAVHSAHDLGLAKEETAFWDRLQAAEPFDPDNTLLIDDNASVLRSAQAYGIRHLIAVLLPDTTQPVRQVADFPGVKDFQELMPGGGGQ